MVVVYPNQKIVTVHKAPADKEHLYGVLNKDALFWALQNLTGNEVKVFLYLSFNQPEYCMALSSSDIAAKVGTTEDGVRKAVQGLAKKGYIVQSKGRYYDFYEIPQIEQKNSEMVQSDSTSVIPEEKQLLTTGKDSVCREKHQGEIINENTLKNTIDYMQEDLSVPDSSEWDMVLQRIKVTCFSHTLRRLKEVAGCSPDARVVGRIISQNWPAFEKGLGEQEGYRFNTLLNLVKDQYRKVDHTIAIEDVEHLHTIEQIRNEPRINYDALCRTEPKREGLDDISALLDEMFSEYDDVS